MEESISEKQPAKSKHGIHNLKICAFCGKQEGKHWARHCELRHNGVKQEWDHISEPKEAWCENWKEVHGGAKPKNIHSSFRPGPQIRKRDKKGSSTSDASLSYQDSIYNLS